MSELSPLRRKKQPKATRAAMLEAAGRLFAEHGFSATGLGAIVDEAGLTKGALFHHFDDKAALGLVWIQEIILSSMEQDWFEPMTKLTSLEDMRAFLRSRAETMDSRSAVSALALITSEAALTQAAYAEACETIFERWRGAFSSALERGQADGWIHPSIKAKSEAGFMVASFTGLAVTMRCSPNETSRRSFSVAFDAYVETMRIS